MPHQHHQVINQVANFADKMLAAGLARLAGGLDDFGAFFDDLGSNLLHAAGQQLARVRFLVRLGRPSRDRAFQLVEWLCVRSS